MDYKKLMFLMSAVILPFSISCSSVTPHDNFKNNMKSNIGRKVDDETSYVARYEGWLVSSYVIENGNVENKYQWRGSCIFYFEINKTTNTIVNWRFEGSADDCAIVP